MLSSARKRRLPSTTSNCCTHTRSSGFDCWHMVEPLQFRRADNGIEQGRAVRSDRFHHGSPLRFSFVEPLLLDAMGIALIPLIGVKERSHCGTTSARGVECGPQSLTHTNDAIGGPHRR